MRKNYFFTICLITISMIVVSFSSFGQSLPVFYGSGAMAVPNNLIEYEQPDGTTLSVYLQGDAVVNWFTTEDGYALLRNNDEIFEYAVEDTYGNLVSSGVKARNIDNRTQNEIELLNQTEKSLFYSDSQVNELKANAKIGKKNESKMGGFPTTGTRKLLMILANFNNTSTTYSQSDFNNYMNQTNYNGTGSFKDYYYEVSYGQLTINTTVTAWVTVPNTHDYYGPDAKWAEFIRDAVNAADNAGVDFSQFDNDGDGNVDGVAVIHQGPGQEETGDTDDIWSHNWSLSYGGYNVYKDGVKVDAYTCQPEKSGSGMATIGVMCHEFGHNLGAPDYYDTDYSTGGQYNGTGYWDIMASGSYNGSPGGSKPAHHNAWTKVLYGWLTPQTLSSATSITAGNVEENKSVYKYTTTTSGEYFLIENRQKIGFDSALPGQGLMIYRIHKDAISTYNSNNLNNTHPQKVYPVCASSTYSMPSSSSSSYGSVNTSGCAWPYSSKTSFTDATSPSAKSWAGANTNKPITNIVLNTSTKTVSFDFMGGASDPTAPTAAATAASNITMNAAKLNGTVNANQATTTVTFQYGTTTSYGTNVNATPNSVTGSASTAVSANISGLAANTTYHFRIKAVNSYGTTYSSDMTFTTEPMPQVYTIPFTENFGSTIPADWSQINDGSGITDRWAPSNTNKAGGTAYEMKCSYQQIDPANARLVTPALNTVGYNELTLNFNHMLDAYGTGATLKIQTSNDGINWTDAWSVATTSTNINATTQTVTLTSNLNNPTTYVAFVASGNIYQIDYWYIDNVSITGSSTPIVELPTVSTTSASNVGTTTATTGGNVTDDGGANVTAKGVCYSTSQNPTISNNKTTNGSGTGSFTANLTGLNPNTTYYVRAYATNSEGTAYGSQISFTTDEEVVISLPTVSTTSVSGIGSTSATSGGNVTSDGGATVTSKGICWSTSQNPTTANYKTTNGSGTGSFTANMTGLNQNTTYYVRAYATNSQGTAYGSQVSFTTDEEIISGYSIPFTENFSSSFPADWSQVNDGSGITDRWATSNTNKAGGTAYEMKCSWQQVNPANARLVTPAINTVGYSQLTLEFKHMLDAYGTGATLKVQTSTNGTTWTDAWSIATTSSNINATTQTVTLNTNLNSSTTYVAFVLSGNIYQIDYWYLDNVSITAGTTPVVELPSISTASATSVTVNSAVTGGNITSNGGGTITTAGVCYSTSSNPTVSNSKVATSTTSGSFTTTLSGLSANTTYYARAYATNSAGTSYGSQISFTTDNEQVVLEYCTSNGNNTSYEWIDLVKIGTINNSTGKSTGGYGDYTSLSTNLERGSSVTIYLSCEYSSSSYTEYFRVYFDFNQDGDFADSGESVGSVTCTAEGTTYSKTFTIPATASLGTTRMRVVMSDNSSTSYCGSFNYGETEDYTVNITVAGASPNFAFSEINAEEGTYFVQKDFNVYPNPAVEFININVQTEQVISVQIFNVAGMKVIDYVVDEYNPQINVSNLTSGTYIIRMEDGQKSFTDKFIKY